mgnify:FL=1
MVQTSERLKREGFRSVIIDLTSIGSAISPSEWYFGLLSRLSRELSLSIDEQAWWQARSEQSPIQRFSDFLREVVLEEIPEKIVIFVDEIDSTLKLDFTDDFFAAIRAAYNARSTDRAYDRLTFVLLGVARPADLIKDRTRTPYNIGTSVNVTDFQQDELQAFEDVLEEALPRQGREVLRWALNWTSGQPYLTQKLCAEIIEQTSGELTESALSELVKNLFLGDQARTETNLRSIRDRASGNPYAAKMLRIYNKVLKGKEVASEERSIEQNELKLTGLVRVSSQGNLLVRNRIYARTFDLDWVKDNIPVTTGQRLSMALSIITVLALGFAGYFYYQQQNQAREVLAQTYTENFTTSASQEIRISGLAGLFHLGDEYAVQVEELFNGLSHEEQLALLNLETPENVGDELFVVTEALYQEQRNTPEGNELLLTMAGILEQTSASGVTSLTLEINAWLDGREQAEQGVNDSAITFYTNAWKKSQQRGQENPGVLYDRGMAYAATEEYDLALLDYDLAASITTNKYSEIGIAISENQELKKYFAENKNNYPNLSEITVTTNEAIVFPDSEPIQTIPPVIVSEKDGMELLYVPAGEFEMGSKDGDADENTVQIVYLDAFRIDKTEVTNTMYAKFLQEINVQRGDDFYHLDDITMLRAIWSGYDVRIYQTDDGVWEVEDGYENHPANDMSFFAAKTYCEHVGRRLPTDKEWEKAASWNDITREKYTFPWGNTFDCTRGNFHDQIFEKDRELAVEKNCDGYHRSSPVGTFSEGASPYGALDMAGNVAEFVDYEYSTMRGGSWYMFGYRTSYRPIGPDASDSHRSFFSKMYLGFRCAQNVE